MKLRDRVTSEAGYGEVNAVVWLLVALAVLFFVLPWIAHLSWAVFGPLGALIVVVLVVLLFLGR